MLYHLSYSRVVGARGFEPPTPASQTLCAAGLRHAPLYGSIHTRFSHVKMHQVDRCDIMAVAGHPTKARGPHVLQSQPIFTASSAFASCHAATLVEPVEGELLAAWFGGTHEGHPDVAIWMAHYDGTRWSEPFQVADEPEVPLWNPVLFRDPTGTIWLFYKVGPSVPSWTGMYIRSQDGGRSWSEPTMLPAGLLGPAKNKPITLRSGVILCGTSHEAWQNWACWVERSQDGGRTWTKHGPITAPDHHPGRGPVVSARWDPAAQTLILPEGHRGVIQPTIWEYAPNRLRMLMRATRQVGAICVTDSDDGGCTWSPTRLTEIPNPNSGLDAVRLADGRIVLACNPTREGRTPLSLLASADNGASWPWRRDLETGEGEYSYPSIIQTTDGLIHLVYTYRRTHIQHVIIDPDLIAP